MSLAKKWKIAFRPHSTTLNSFKTCGTLYTGLCSLFAQFSDDSGRIYHLGEAKQPTWAEVFASFVFFGNTLAKDKGEPVSELGCMSLIPSGAMRIKGFEGKQHIHTAVLVIRPLQISEHLRTTGSNGKLICRAHIMKGQVVVTWHMRRVRNKFQMLLILFVKECLNSRAGYGVPRCTSRSRSRSHHNYDAFPPSTCINLEDGSCLGVGPLNRTLRSVNYAGLERIRIPGQWDQNVRA